MPASAERSGPRSHCRDGTGGHHRRWQDLYHSVGVAPLLKDLNFAALLADKAFDSDVIRADLDDRGAVAVIPPKANRAVGIPCDFEMYKWRHLIENCFCKIKEFRRIATRYDKTDESFKAMIHLVGIVLATR